jgi:hypothetical protein
MQILNQEGGLSLERMMGDQIASYLAFRVSWGVPIIYPRVGTNPPTVSKMNCAPCGISAYQGLLSPTQSPYPKQLACNALGMRYMIRGHIWELISS